MRQRDLLSAFGQNKNDSEKPATEAALDPARTRCEPAHVTSPPATFPIHKMVQKFNLILPSQRHAGPMSSGSNGCHHIHMLMTATYVPPWETMALDPDARLKDFSTKNLCSFPSPQRSTAHLTDRQEWVSGRIFFYWSNFFKKSF